MKNYQNNNLNRADYEHKYNISRVNLLIAIVFTVINIFLVLVKADVYFLFSIFVPYFLAYTAALTKGIPNGSVDANGDQLQLANDIIFKVLMITAIVVLLIYLLAWIMSRKNYVGWLIFALFIFTFDSLIMLFIKGISYQSLFDLLFHAWVIFYLIIGITSSFKLKKLPVIEPSISNGEALVQENITNYNDGLSNNEEIEEVNANNSPILRRADMEVKHRVLLSVHTLNYDICYRRVKHTNELVINGYVYDEIVGIVEVAHRLSANVGGHHISAGYTGMHSIIIVDNQVVSKKIRLF